MTEWKHGWYRFDEDHQRGLGVWARKCCEQPRLAAGCEREDGSLISATLNLGVTDGVTSVEQDGPSSFGGCSYSYDCDSCSGLDGVALEGRFRVGWPNRNRSWCCNSWHATLYGGMKYNLGPEWKAYYENPYTNPAPPHPGFDTLPGYGGECETTFPPGTPSWHQKPERVVWGWDSVSVNVSGGCKGITASASLSFVKAGEMGLFCSHQSNRTYACGRKLMQDNVVFFECRPADHPGLRELQSTGTDCSTLAGGSLTLWPRSLNGHGVGNGQYFLAGPEGSQCVLAASSVTLNFGGGGGGGAGGGAGGSGAAFRTAPTESHPDLSRTRVPRRRRSCGGCGGGLSPAAARIVRRAMGY